MCLSNNIWAELPYTVPGAAQVPEPSEYAILLKGEEGGKFLFFFLDDFDLIGTFAAMPTPEREVQDSLEETWSAFG